MTVPNSAATIPMMIAMLRGVSQNPCLVFSNRSAFITATLSSSSVQIAHAAVRCRWFCTYSRSAISICFVRDRPSARAMTASSALKSAGRRSVKDASAGGLLAAGFFRALWDIAVKLVVSHYSVNGTKLTPKWYHSRETDNSLLGPGWEHALGHPQRGRADDGQGLGGAHCSTSGRSTIGRQRPVRSNTMNPRPGPS